LSLAFQLCGYGESAAQAAPIQSRQKSNLSQVATPDEETANSAQAMELLRRAREALGGEQALERIKSLSVSGKVRTPVKYVSIQSAKKVVEKEKTLSGKVELDFLLPDKFRKRSTGKRLSGFPFSYFQVVNGERAWRNPPMRAISSDRDRRVIDVGDFERTIELQERGARRELTIYLFVLLLKSIPSYPLKYCYLGRVQ